MERKLRLSLIGKELKRFWWLGAAMLLLVALIITIYSTVIYVPTFTVEAGEHVYFKPIGSGDTVKAFDVGSVYKRINDQLLKDYLNQEILKRDIKKNVKKEDVGKLYKLTFDSNVYTITVTMLKKDDAIAIAEDYIEYVKKAIISGNFNSNDAELSSNTVTAPILKSEVGLTPAKICIFGFGGAVLLYLFIVGCVFYFNRKLYNAAEFQDNFETVVLEPDVKKNGYKNTIIKLQVQCKAQGGPYVLAVDGKIDEAEFIRALQSEGFSILKTSLQGVLSKNRELVLDQTVDCLVGDNSTLSTAKECKQDLKKNYPYDFILIFTDNSTNRNVKNYITVADIADGTILGFNLKTDTYKAICEIFNELYVVKDLNLLGVVL